jgi:AsmA protein
MPLRLFRGLARGLAWALAGLLAVLSLLVLALALFGWNWARAPVQHLVLQKTGRVLHITGPLLVVPAWPMPLVRVGQLSLANPAWAQAPQLLQAEALEARIDLREALRGRLAFAELRLVRPRLFLEQGVDAAGVPRKTWLFDKAQSDDSARVPVGQLVLEQAEVSYIDAGQRTRLQLRLSTGPGGQGASPVAEDGPAGAPAGTPRLPLVFAAEGQFRGQALQAQGRGGGVLAWRDESRPYPLQLTGRIGATKLQVEGTVTGLLRLSAMNLQLQLSGPDLAALYPLLGVALPPTPAYSFKGPLQREGARWRIGPFQGQVGQSDVAGSLQLATGGPRPVMTGQLTSRRLHLADLGPAVGAAPQAPGQAPPARVLPELPFDTARWASLDADVTLAAQTLIRPGAVPLEQLQLRFQLQDRRVTLNPLNFALAGGQARAQVVLDARSLPLRGRLGLQLRGVQLARLFPQAQWRQASLGRLDGDAELSGQGPSVGRMLGSAEGRISVVAQQGLISRLLMEQIGLHLLEMLRLNLGGDETVALNCAVADFAVVQGEMRPRVLVLDTAVSTVTGSGLVSLSDERFDLRFVPRTKVSSLVALRSPLYLRGPFRAPAVTLDGGAIATRGLGALALGLVNPLLALLPLFDAGPGQASPCAQLVRDLQGPAAPATATTDAARSPR